MIIVINYFINEIQPALLSGDIAAFLAGNLTAGRSLSSTVSRQSSITAPTAVSTSTKATDASTVARSSIGRLSALTNLVVYCVTFLK